MTNISADALRQQVVDLLPYTLQVYEMLHQNPEPSGEERQTAAFIRGELEALGLAWEPVLDHGTLALLDTNRPDRKSTRLNSSHRCTSRMPSSA